MYYMYYRPAMLRATLSKVQLNEGKSNVTIISCKEPQQWETMRALELSCAAHYASQPARVQHLSPFPFSLPNKSKNYYIFKLLVYTEKMNYPSTNWEIKKLKRNTSKIVVHSITTVHSVKSICKLRCYYSFYSLFYFFYFFFFFLF